MEMEFCLLLTFLLSLAGLLLVGRKNRRKAQGQYELPPGSMGWPYVGETLQLYSQDPNVFFITKQKRYGEIFKSHLLGCPCVMLASPEAARFVLVTQAHLFKPTYPRSKERMIGPWALFFHQGDYHARIRKLVQGSLSPEALRGLVPGIDSLVTALLEAWAGDGQHATFHAMKKFSFDVSILTIFGGRLDERHKQELSRNYFIVDKGYNSFPTIFPGTLYQKAMEARKRLRGILREIMSERRRGEPQKDLLGSLMDSKDEHGEQLTDDQIADNIIGVMFAAQDTTASVMTWVVKFLHDNPKLLESVKAEQMVIWEANNFGTRPLSWAQARSMVLTHKFILESLRMASVISFAFREAVADVEYKGYLIPKGWKVMPLFRNIHYNADLFQEPRNFDPSRFDVAPKPNTFLPFGTGVHACPGNELAKLEMFVLIHHLVTKYRWEIVGNLEEATEYCPFPVPKHGLPTKLWRVNGSCVSSSEAGDRCLLDSSY